MSDLDVIDPLDLAARLMEIESTSGREEAVVDWMHGFLAGREWSVQRIPVSPARDDVFATPAGEVARIPRVTLSTHLDTVPPFIPPRIDGDPLRGETTVNIGSLAGGVADNVLAPSAEARLMIRLVGPADVVWRLIEQCIGDRASVEQGPTVQAVRLGVLPGFPTSVAAYATD